MDIKLMKDRYLPFLYIGLAIVIWGISFVSTKIALDEIPPVSIAFFRQIIALFVLIPICLIGGHLPRVSFKDLQIMIAGGFTGTVAYFVFENIGLQYTTASDASLIINAFLPIATLITEALIFKINVSRGMVACMALSMVGVYLVVTVNGSLDFTSTRFYGNLLILGAMFSWVAYSLMNKGILRRYSSITLTTYQAMASIFLFLPFIFREVGSWKPLSEISPFTLANLAFLGLFCSGFAYFFYLYALGKLGATVTSTFLNLLPVVTAVFGYLVLDERLTKIQVLGMGQIAIAILSLSRLTLSPAQRPNASPDK